MYQQLENWLDHDADELVAAWGPPTSEHIFKNGTKVMVYRQDGLYGLVNPVFGNYMGPRILSTVPSTCEITLQVSPENKIARYSLKGNSCRADKLGTTK